MTDPSARTAGFQPLVPQTAARLTSALTVIGSPFADTILGGGDGWLCRQGEGNRLSGGGGADDFGFREDAVLGQTTITEFGVGDQIILPGFGSALVDAFTGSNDAELRHVIDGRYGRIEDDRGGDGVADGTIVLFAGPALVVADNPLPSWRPEPQCAPQRAATWRTCAHAPNRVTERECPATLCRGQPFVTGVFRPCRFVSSAAAIPSAPH